MTSHPPAPPKCRRAAFPTSPVAPATTIFLAIHTFSGAIYGLTSRGKRPRGSHHIRYRPQNEQLSYNFGVRLRILTFGQNPLIQLDPPLIPGNRLAILPPVWNF